MDGTNWNAETWMRSRCDPDVSPRAGAPRIGAGHYGPDSRYRPSRRFELKWIDLPLGLFGASMTGLAWLLCQWLQNWPDRANSVVPNFLVPLDSEDIALGAIGIVGGLFVLGVCLVIALAVLV